MTGPGGRDGGGVGSAPLDGALSELVRIGTAAGLTADDVRAEGAAFAAALSESSPGAPAAWTAVVGGTTQSFFDAASRARRWRGAPTAGLTSLLAARSAYAADYARALVEVSAAASSLGDPALTAIGNAATAAAAQLRAAGVGSADGAGPSITALPVDPRLLDRLQVTHGITLPPRGDRHAEPAVVYQ